MRIIQTGANSRRAQIVKDAEEWLRETNSNDEDEDEVENKDDATTIHLECDDQNCIREWKENKYDEWYDDDAPDLLPTHCSMPCCHVISFQGKNGWNCCQCGDYYCESCTSKVGKWILPSTEYWCPGCYWCPPTKEDSSDDSCDERWNGKYSNSLPRKDDANNECTHNN